MNEIKNENYINHVKINEPKSKYLKTMVFAFITGGLICCAGQGVRDLLKTFFTLSKEQNSAFVTIIMIFIGATLTGLGVYDRIGKYAGAGSIIPITGFANSVVSPAMEYKSEGMIYGVASKIFIISGPIIVYGICSSVLVGLIYYIIGLF